MEIYKYPDKGQWSKLVKRPAIENVSLEKKVKKILDKVKNNGDKAIRKYAKEFDGIKLKNILVSDKELANAEGLISNELKNFFWPPSTVHRLVNT